MPDVSLPHRPAKGSIPSHEATVYMPTPFHVDAIAYAHKRFKEVLVVSKVLTEDECLSRADGILLRIGKLPRSSIAKAPRLQIISRNGVGHDSIDRAACEERGIVVTTCPGGNAKPVAEVSYHETTLVLTLTLSLLRRVKEINEIIRADGVRPSITVLAPGLFGKTVGLVGMGDIAVEVAKIFSTSFGCKVLVYSPTSASTRWTYNHPTDPIVPHQRFSTLAEMLPHVDVLSLHCPLLSTTRHLISTSEIALMRPTSILINTARGGVVDEDALERALREGRISGAGIDVWEEEPPRPAKYGTLLEMPNVIGLPHLGGSTEAETRDGCMRAVDEVADWLDGKGVRSRVY